ncbi:hypothetical protein FHETE_6089 [Fusarium heterosporum]|uniref:Uncharacterized protein n=1 Tax=Fusarium heterosporum TaxID=42747 RepID=A0A8H5WQ11_FUSHE|nr:hypothetical protein FHETE_6089 [Fusarium heterosporum]
MKFTTLATAIFTLGFGADLAAAACCEAKVCDGFDLKGNCKNACYPYLKMAKVNMSGLKSGVGSAKTNKGCFCTFGKGSTSCMLADSNKKGANAPNNCLSGINNVYCQRS